MDKRINDYNNELTKKVNRTLEKIDEAKAELKKYIDGDRHSINEFGLAKYAEKITKLQGELSLLYELQDTFEAIFNVD